MDEYKELDTEYGPIIQDLLKNLLIEGWKIAEIENTKILLSRELKG